MGIGDSIRKQISNLINNPSKVLGDKASVIIKGINAGGGGLEEAEKLLDELKNLEKRKETLQAAEQQLNNIVNTVSATKKTAVALKEANTIGSALNPAAAAISVVQDKLQNKIEKEIEDVKSAKDALGPAVDGLGNFIGDTKQKLAKAIADKKKRDQLKKDREEALRN
jgi:DNA repair exonuclease SbcCD ATPase subunit